MMIRPTLKSVGFLLLAGVSAHAAAALTADKLYAKASPAVWRVFAFDAAGKPFSQGTAVVVGKETLLTNCHVIAKAKGFVIKHENQSFDAKLQHIDVERDLCQITARNLTAPALPVGDSNNLAVGQRIYTLGSPRGLELTLSDGLISALRKDDNNRLFAIQISAPISPGSSGGALLDDEGRLIGLTSAGIRDGQNLNLAIPINWWRDLPERSAAALAKFAAEKKAATEGKNPAPDPAPKSVPDTGQGGQVAGTSPAMSGRSRVKPVPSGYADINDIEKVVQINPKVRAAYEDFLTRPFPRAFAFSVAGGWWASWSRKPKNPASPIEPADRVIPDCENYHQRHCYIYAIDDVVVYKPTQN